METPQVPTVPLGTSAAPAVPPRYRKPSTGPTAEDLRDRTRWQELSEQSLASTQAAAEKWRTGLAAFVTLATGGLLLKGPSAASDVTTGWRIALTILALGGLAAAICGLWLALQAAAGTPAKLNLTEVVAKYGGVHQFEVACALATSARLRLARLVIAGSLLLFVAAIGTWWWAPPRQSDSPALISIITPSGVICGTLISADDGAFTVVNGSRVVRVPFVTATKGRIVTSCLGQGGCARDFKHIDACASGRLTCYSVFRHRQWRKLSQSPRGTVKIYQIEISNFCNLSCSYCPHPAQVRAKGNMSWRTFEKSIELLLRCGQRTAYLHNFGEPLLHPHVVDFVHHCTERGVEASFFTNGILLTGDLLTRLAEAGLRYLSVSEHTRGEAARVKALIANAGLPIEIRDRFRPQRNQLHTWADQVTHGSGRLPVHPSEGPGPCLFQRQQAAVVLWDGRIGACCIDVEGRGEQGTIDDYLADPSSYEFRPINLCRGCSLMRGAEDLS